jgi:hypothetical protein
MPYKYTVQKGDTLNKIAQRHGFENYKKAGIESVPSGNFDMIRPGETVTLANYQQPVQYDTTEDHINYEKNNIRYEQNYGSGGAMGSSEFDKAQEGPNGGALTQVSEVDMGDGTKVVVYSDGSQEVVGQKKEGTAQTTQENIDTRTKEITDKYNKEIDYATSELDRIGAQQDQNTNNLIESIKQTYASRIEIMEDLNNRSLQGERQVGIRSGRSRYTNQTNRDILTDTEKRGIDRVAKLEGEMLSLIVQAEQARTEEDIELFNERMDRLNEINDNMQNEIVDMQKSAYDALDALREEQKAATEEEEAQMQLLYDRSEESAPAIAEALGGYESDEERAEFLLAYSEKTGIPMEVLISDVQSYVNDREEQELDLKNTKSLIEQRQRSNDISAGRLALDQQKYEFNPTSDERAKVNKYLANEGTDEDTQKAKDDPEFFYYILSLVDEDEL